MSRPAYITLRKETQPCRKSCFPCPPGCMPSLTVVLIGHYLLLAIIYLPVLAQEKSGGVMLSAISKRSRLWLYALLLVFAITGIHLTVSDANCLSLGNFGNPWSILMLVKHLLVLAMIALGFWFNVVLCVGTRDELGCQGEAGHSKLHSVCQIDGRCRTDRAAPDRHRTIRMNRPSARGLWLRG